MSVLAVSDEALLKAWGNANFGSIVERSIESKRRLLAMSAIKVQAGWHVGSTSTDILLELELFKELGFRRMGVMTTRGRTFVWQTLHRESYQDDVYLLGEAKEKIKELESKIEKAINYVDEYLVHGDEGLMNEMKDAMMMEDES